MQPYSPTSGTMSNFCTVSPCIAMGSFVEPVLIFQNFRTIVQLRSIGTTHKSLYTIDQKDRKKEREGEREGRCNEKGWGGGKNERVDGEGENWGTGRQQAPLSRGAATDRLGRWAILAPPRHPARLYWGCTFQEGLSLIRENKQIPDQPCLGIPSALMAGREDQILHFIDFLHYFEPQAYGRRLCGFPAQGNACLGCVEQ